MGEKSQYPEMKVAVVKLQSRYPLCAGEGRFLGYLTDSLTLRFRISPLKKCGTSDSESFDGELGSTVFNYN